MSDKVPYFQPDQEGIKKVLFNKASLPDSYWDIEVIPRFRDVQGTQSTKQDAMTQAQVFNSLLNNPKQILEWPRRWKLAAYASSTDRAALTLSAIIRQMVLANIRVQCCKASGLKNIHSDRVDVVFCYSAYTDMSSEDIMALREAHHNNYHLFYVMDGTVEQAASILKIAPDYVFNIDSVALNKTKQQVIK